jgi:D-alanine-D-alanine ligase-like ATP-grasp enzyme
MKKFTRFRTVIFSRHPSHDKLRGKLPLLPFRSVIRLGSTTPSNPRLNRIELNSIESVKISSNKLLMKQKFTEAGVKTADWWTFGGGDIMLKNSSDNQNRDDISTLPYPIVVKHIRGSRGTGNYKIDNQEQLKQWIVGKTLFNYIAEAYTTMNREYRLHVSKNGCFYTCRKVLKSDTPEYQRWFRNDSNSNWLVADNESFDKPVNWDLIVEDCKKALTAIGADILAFDVKVQSAKKANGVVRENPEWIILESNSAPSMGAITLIKYLTEIPKLLLDKYGK